MNTASNRKKQITESLNELMFGDIFNLEDIQRLQDLFSDATGVASLITQPDGTPITRPSNFCHLCQNIIRKTNLGLTNCIKSDVLIGRQHSSGPVIQPCLSGGLWDAGASISVGGRHIANWLIGQVRNEELDEQKMLHYADEIGANREDFMLALSEVPVMSPKQFKKVSEMLFAFANELSEKAYNNMQLRQQITDRNRAAELLRESEENFSITLHSIGDAVISTDKFGLIVNINPIAESLCGYTKAEASGRPLTEVFNIINSETRKTVADPVKKVLESGQIIGLANHTVLISKTGAEYQIADSAAPIKNKDGHICGVVLVFSDVTEKYNAQKQIKESEERYSGLLTYLDAGVVVHAPDTSIIINNPKASELLGLSEDQMRGKLAFDPDWKFLTPKNTPLPLEEYPVTQIISSHKPIKEFLIGVNRPETNDVVWLIVNGFPVLDSQGDIIEIVISFIDITERKIAEEELRGSEEKFRNVFENSVIGKSMTSIDGKLKTNKAFSQMLGYTEDELLNLNWKEITHPDDIEDNLKITKSILSGERNSARWEKRYIHKDGSFIWVDINTILQRDKDGKPLYFITTINDINTRKQAEINLKESEEKYRSLVNDMQAGVLIQGPQSEIIMSNPKALEFLGLSEDQILGKTSFDPDWNVIHEDGSPFPGNTHPVPRAIETRSPVRDVVMGIYRPGIGDRIWLLVCAEPLLNRDGTVLQVVCTFADITKRIQAEEMLEKERLLFRTLIDNIPDSIYSKDLNCRKTLANVTEIRYMGAKSEADVLGKDDFAFYSKDIAEGFFADDQSVLQTGKPVLNREEYILDENGQKKWLLSSKIPLRDKDNKIIGLVGIGRDNTERKLAELALRESEEKYRLIFEHSPLGLLSFDENGVILACNTSFAHIIGSNPEKLVGMNMLQLPDKELAMAVQKALDGETGIYEDFYHTVTSDKIVPVRALFAPMKLTEGNILGGVGIIEDITVRKQAEDALQASETLYRNLVEKLPDGVYKSTHEGKFVDVNPAMASMLGYESKEELMAVDIKTELYFNLSDRESVSLKEGKEEIGVYLMRKKDGSEIWIEDHGWLNLDEKENVLYHEGVMRDVTERKHAEEILLKSEERHRTILQTAMDGFWMADKDGNLLEVNETYCRMSGYSTQELLTMKVSDVEASENNGEIENRIQKLIEKGENRYESQHRRKDGSIYDVEVNIKYQPVEGGRLVAFMHDISDRKRFEQELIKSKETAEESENKFRDILDNTKLHLWAFDGKRYTYCSKNWYDYTGQPITSPLTIELWISHVHPDDVEKSGDVWMKNWVAKQEHDNYFRLRRNDGTYRHFYSHAVPIYNKNGSFKHFLGYNIDISDQVEAEKNLLTQNLEYASLNQEYKKQNEDLQKAKEHAEESDRLKSAFLANMSHEIRTPMNGILGFAELLKTPDLTGEQQQEYIRIIKKSGDRMLNIINDIVDISKIEAGLMSVFVSDTNINDQTHFIYTFFKPEAENKNIQLICNNGRIGNNFTIKTDREKVYAILTNLVKNAIKYTKTGTIEFGYKMVPVGTLHATSPQFHATSPQLHATSPQLNATSPQLQFYVKDTGIGIAADRQHAIFERFVQADIADKWAFQGAGLGLSISKAYVEMLGGTLWVESEEGKGSTFYFTIPYTTEPEIMIDPTPPLPNGEKSNAVKMLKTLVVEDDETSEILVTIAVKIYSSEILRAATGAEAVEICRNNPDIDLVLMDIKMPVMDGYEATSRIRQFNKNVVIIAQTAFGLTGDREKALQAGCNDYIAKPIQIVVLKELIQTHFKILSN